MEEEKRDVTKDKLEDKIWLYVILVEHIPQSRELIKVCSRKYNLEHTVTVSILQM